MTFALISTCCLLTVFRETSMSHERSTLGDGFQTQMRGSWIPVKERVEKVLADAIDGRKEWIFKFFSESNVWTRRCRRCYKNIATGLRGTYGQAVAARTGEWSTGSSSSDGEEVQKSRSREAQTEELRTQVEQFWRQRGKQYKTDRVFRREGPVVRKKSGLWIVRTRSKAERWWMSRGKLQKDL